MLVVVLWLAAPMTTPARSAAVGPLLEDAARALPKVGRVEFRLSPGVRLTSLSRSAYGITERAAISRLDLAKASAVEAIDATVNRVTDSSESAKLARGCAKNAFEGVARDYIEAARDGARYPVFADAFYYVVDGCLTTTFPHAETAAVDAVAGYLTGRTSESAREVANTAPSALANWASATANDLSAEVTPTPTVPEPQPTTPTESPTSDNNTDGGSAFPWWILIFPGGALLVFLALRKRS
jgi:hypothetical protein